MDIIEIKKRKRDLEKAIGNLLVDFEIDTGTRVEEISIERVRVEEFGERPESAIGEIKVKATIP